MATSITAQVLTHLLQKEIHWTTRIFGFAWKVKRTFLPAFIFSPCSLSTVLNFSPETKGSVFHTTLLASFSILNKGLILCRCDNSYEWSAMCPRYAIIFERGSRITNVARNTGWFMNVGTKKGPKTEELGTEFLKNCVKSTTHSRMWTRPRQLAPCDMLIFLAKWLYFSHSRLALCPWHQRFEMVKSREESERDPACSVVLRLQSYSCFMAVWCREENEREERKNWEVLRKRKTEVVVVEGGQEIERAGSPGLLSHPLRHPVLSLTHRPTFYLTYLARLLT